MKTVKVRVTVAIDPTGYWNAVGWKGSHGDELDNIADPLDDPFTIHYLTAELPIPEPQEIAAEVEEQK